ncbi:glycosyl transferase [Geminocystis sp. NIES-3708]|uniref:glycosyltransferase family 4 protein n=1 Tax=Geminocystis sp. NIES-3708 TaxID=1615909 RepID=UPI0005FC9A3D|nr:glycosyltransferase family 4 protein [Geminocystis sp. NIES-3708]BAQ60055.1 glycosyl transferase [Geminocystis sp. NIES-3708]
MIKILHIIDKLSSTGPARSLIASAKYALKQNLIQEHCIITLHSDVYPLTLIQAKQAQIKVFRKPDREILIQEIEKADIVQIHFWNNPSIYEFLSLDFPPMRLLLWFKIIGDKPPQIITTGLLSYSDFALTTSPYTLNLPIFDHISENQKDIVYGIADDDRLKNLQPQPHNTFNVGYIGTVNFAKMHPHYISMSGEVSIPNVKFIVCGGGIEKQLQEEVNQLGIADKFDFRGYVENIKQILAILDVFGYPLCEDTYATSEKSLQEAMYAGIPPVVFPYGGVKCLVTHNQNGLIVNSESEYRNAIEYLYHYPEERIRLGKNARHYALENFNSKYWAKKLHNIYQQMMALPKRKRLWQDIINFSQNKTPAQLFIESLGESAPQFQVSLSCDDTQELLSAEAKIAQSSVLLSAGEGGIIQYRNYYPDDAYLRLWCGLVLQNQHRYSSALSEFEISLNLGFNHWRIYWYIAQCAIVLKDLDTAKTSLEYIINNNPQFILAQKMLNSLFTE